MTHFLKYNIIGALNANIQNLNKFKCVVHVSIIAYCKINADIDRIYMKGDFNEFLAITAVTSILELDYL